MGKQCVVIAVLFPVLEHRYRSTTRIPGLTKNPPAGIDVLILDVGEAFAESNCGGLIREWAREASLLRITTRYSALVFRDRVARNRMQDKGLGAALVGVESG